MFASARFHQSNRGSYAGKPPASRFTSPSSISRKTREAVQQIEGGLAVDPAHIGVDLQAIFLPTFLQPPP
jgi:hypothetical protein